jgi:D-sedoheptulose 7-phosphate isomerase
MLNATEAQERVRAYLLASAGITRRTAQVCASDIARAAALLAACLADGGKLLLCGNGGSAADCQHIAAELVSVLCQDFVRPAMAAIALTTDTSLLTASANDFGQEVHIVIGHILCALAESALFDRA